MQTTEMVHAGNGTALMANAAALARSGSSAPTHITLEQRQILRSMVDRNSSDAQIEMLILVANRYDLDPILGHVVLISGKVFVTHKGLMHKAHTSGQLDGIETEYGKDEGGDWCECRVWRKDMTRPFTGRIYLGEYRNNNPVWKQYPKAMAAKTAESFILRRAFDISLTSQEEMGINDAPPTRVYSAEEKAERKSLGGQISAASAALSPVQFGAFKTKVFETGGLNVMETGNMETLLSEIQGMAMETAAAQEAAADVDPFGEDN